MNEKQPLQQPTSSSRIPLPSTQDCRPMRPWCYLPPSLANTHSCRVLQHSRGAFLKQQQQRVNSFICVMELNWKWNDFQGLLLRNSTLEAASLNTNYSENLIQVPGQLFKLSLQNTILNTCVKFSQLLTKCDHSLSASL